MRLKILFLVFSLLASNAFADTILLKSGQEVTGDIIKRQDDSITIKFQGVALTYYMDEIRSVNGQRVGQPVSRTVEPKPQTYSAPVSREPVEVTREPVETIQEPVVADPEPEALDFWGEQAPAEVNAAAGTEGAGRISQPDQPPADLGAAVAKAIDPDKSFDQLKESMESMPKDIKLSPAAKKSLYLLVLVPSLLFVFLIISIWVMYDKAGQPGWGSIIPIYNLYLLCKIAQRPGWWLLLMFIPIVSIFIYILIYMDIAKNFGKGAGFGLGLFFLPFIFIPILAFGDAQYSGGGMSLMNDQIEPLKPPSLNLP